MDVGALLKQKPHQKNKNVQLDFGINFKTKTMSKFFFDTEFLEGTQSKAFGKRTKPTIDLISIGIVAEDGREYYAISKDFNLKEAWNRFDLKTDIDNGGMKKVYWIRENVLKLIFWEMYSLFDPSSAKSNYGNYNNFAGDELSEDFGLFRSLIADYGKTNTEIAEEIKTFCSKKLIGENPNQYEADSSPIELYGYYSAYDHVVLMWLFGTMMERSDRFPMFTIDLKQMVNGLQKKSTWVNNFEFKGVIEEDWKTNLKYHPDYPRQINEHNALSDAKWNYQLYLFITKCTWAMQNNPNYIMDSTENKNESLGQDGSTIQSENNAPLNGTPIEESGVPINEGGTPIGEDVNDSISESKLSNAETDTPLNVNKEEPLVEEKCEILHYPKEGDVLTPGQKAVGITFNPSKDPRVDKAKLLAAAAIDQMIELQKDINSFNGTKRHAAIAIADYETAQMRAVKAITWSE